MSSCLVWFVCFLRTKRCRVRQTHMLMCVCCFIWFIMPRVIYRNSMPATSWNRCSCRFSGLYNFAFTAAAAVSRLSAPLPRFTFSFSDFLSLKSTKVLNTKFGILYSVLNFGARCFLRELLAPQKFCCNRTNPELSFWHYITLRCITFVMLRHLTLACLLFNIIAVHVLSWI